MRGVKQCEESTGRMKKHRYSSEFKVTAVKLANHPALPGTGYFIRLGVQARK